MSAMLVVSAAGSRVDNVFYDGLIRWSDRTPASNILIVGIDDASLAELGPWPWPRSTHAAIIDRLAQGGARSIAYDVLFLEPSPDPADDARLASALAAAGNVCLPVLFEAPGENGATFTIRPPLAPYRRAWGLAHTNMEFDPDGVSRGAMLFAGDGRRRLPHLMECARRAALGLPTAAALPDGRRAPALVHETRVMIPYEEPGSFRTVSAAAVLRGETPDEFFRDAYVVVGSTAAGLHDRHATPNGRGGASPGVEVSANLLEALLTGSALKVAGLPLRLAFALGGVALLMAVLAIVPPRWALLAGFGVLAAALGMSAAAFTLAQVWLPPFALILTVLVIFPLWGWRRLEAVSAYFVEELQRFSSEPDALPRASSALRGGDTVARQIELLDETIRRARDLRRFAADTLDSLPDAAVVTSVGGRIIFANAAARRLAGAAGDPAETTLQEFAEGFTETDGKPLTFPEPEQVGEAWHREAFSPGGDPFLVTVAPYRDSSGRLAAWIVRLTDIAELRAAAAQREQIIQLLTHDLRSPQSSILALLETAPKDAIDGGLAERISAFARRTLALANDFVQLARAGSPNLPFELVDLSDVATEAVDDIWPQARRSEIALVLSGAEDEHLIVGDRDLLTRAVMNLLDNALKYGGGAASEIRCVLERVDSAEPGRVRLTVQDQGPGLTPAQCDGLFQPFRRGTAGTGRRPEGAGLGLSLVAEVVRRHGGTARCESALGQGSRFILEFPLQAPAAS